MPPQSLSQNLFWGLVMAMTTGPKWCQMLDWLWHRRPRRKGTGRSGVSLPAQEHPVQVSLPPALFLRSGSVPTTPPFAFLHTTLSVCSAQEIGGSLPSFPIDTDRLRALGALRPWGQGCGLCAWCCFSEWSSSPSSSGNLWGARLAPERGLKASARKRQPQAP